METKTKKQQAREKAHAKVVETYKKLSEKCESKTALWAEMEKRTGYSHQHCRNILKAQGIEF